MKHDWGVITTRVHLIWVVFCVFRSDADHEEVSDVSYVIKGVIEPGRAPLCQQINGLVVRIKTSLNIKAQEHIATKQGPESCLHLI